MFSCILKINPNLSFNMKSVVRFLHSNRKMATFVNTTQDGPLFLIGINRAEKKNCVNHPTALQLIQAFETFNNDPKLKIAILYGENGTFCAGYDLESLSNLQHLSIQPDFLQTNRYMGPSIMRIKKPLIAAIEGYAVAGGLELSLMADLRICAKNAKFGVFCRRVGVPLIDGGTIRLPRIIGLGRALDMILTGRVVDSTEAFEWGLVNRLVENGEALEEAKRVGKLIASHPEQCMLADRASTYFSLDHPEKESLDFELKSVRVLADGVKGATRFINDKKTGKMSKL